MIYRDNIKFCTAIVICFLFILLFLGAIYLSVTKEVITTEKIKCYDEFSNEIIGDVCLKEFSNIGPLKNILLSLITTIVGLLIIYSLINPLSKLNNNLKTNLFGIGKRK